MKSKTVGKASSPVEISNISAHGIWLLVNTKEYFLDYVSFPWFKNATVSQIANVILEHDAYLSWPSLDVDLEIASLEHPEHYPLRCKPRHQSAVHSD